MQVETISLAKTVAMIQERQVQHESQIDLLATEVQKIHHRLDRIEENMATKQELRALEKRIDRLETVLTGKMDYMINALGL